MDSWIQILLTIFSSVLASSGLWAYLTKRNENKGAKTEMLIGLGHDRIQYLGMYYLERRDSNNEAYITRDEYENLNDYLYKPYKKLGGNGSAERIMKEVDKLPIREHHQSERINQ
jgi:hypothetical protein